MLSEFKNRISFNKKVSSELIKETAVTIDTALDIHNKLETYYVNSIDFERLNLVTEKFLRKICRNQINSD
jgi:adenylate cyclase